VRKNLIVGVVGDESVHRTWINEPDLRTFDLCLIYYGPDKDRFAGDGDFYFARQGIKFSLIHDLVHEQLGQTLARYERVWIPDDDIACSTRQINQLFLLAERHNLQISQPAIGQGTISYEALRYHPGYRLRYTRFVEMMCPMFTLRAFSHSLSTFNENVSGWGLDWVWSHSQPRDQVAVIDAVVANHTRPLNSGGVYRRFAAMGVNPDLEGRNLCRKYGVRLKRRHRALRKDTARLRAITTEGRRVWTRPLWPGLSAKRAA